MMLPLTSPFDINQQGESRLQGDKMEEAADDDDGGFHDIEEDSALEGGAKDAEGTRGSTATKKRRVRAKRSTLISFSATVRRCMP